MYHFLIHHVQFLLNELQWIVFIYLFSGGGINIFFGGTVTRYRYH